MVLVLALIALAGALVHNHEDFTGRSFGIFSDVVPLVMYLGVALLGFVPRLRAAATWALLITAWIMVVTALVGLIPRTAMASSAVEYPDHLGVHILVLVVQLPLIVMLIRRLNGAVCRWTAPR
ncbi:hypothetical protein ACH46_11615 [Gordonia phthalatica]|uniref:Uncharacterized protein n=1 Tax=Gordonia phthalatica TaxID=1136941 RepID=A0A0N7FUQ5_9ACTN|nr:hypothetical protein ACH46_11615 [Gordonia phthalatica]